MLRNDLHTTSRREPVNALGIEGLGIEGLGIEGLGTPHGDRPSNDIGSEVAGVVEGQGLLEAAYRLSSLFAWPGHLGGLKEGGT